MRASSRPRVRVARPLLAIFGVLLALQFLSMVFLSRTDTDLRRAEMRLTLVDGIRRTATDYERTSYLAILGLAVEDWELLLRERRDAELLADQFESSAKTLVDGGRTTVGALTVFVEPATNPQIREKLASARTIWKEAANRQVRVIRSRNRSLKDNPDLDEFKSITRQLLHTIEEVSALTRAETERETIALGRVLFTIPILLMLLTSALAAFVFFRVVRPLVRTTGELAMRELELTDNLSALRNAQAQLVQISRQAGRAEMAIGVLHNIGNALTSINVSAEVLLGEVQSSKLAGLGKACGLLERHREDLPAFFAADNPGPKLVSYLRELERHLGGERSQWLGELQSIHTGLDHVTAMIAQQQSLAKSVAVKEEFEPARLLDEVLNLSRASFEREGIAVVREDEDGIVITSDRNKLMQILLNLMSNARHSLREKATSVNVGNEVAEVRVSVRRKNGQLTIVVEDNGIGISEENLSRIFTYGFTTKAEGHGFGLHSSVLAAKELGGKLEAYSAGVGKGARFTVVLPAESGHRGVGPE